MLTVQQVQAKIKQAKKLREAGKYAPRIPTSYYRKRENSFRAKNWDLDMENMLGHSYNWYELVKKINGIVVVNSYRYSTSTSQHISHVERILDAMGVKYVNVQAPRGLQNLELAVEHTMKEIARVELKMKHARKHSAWNESTLNSLNAELIFLRLIFKSKTSYTMEEARENALESREYRLELAREKRAKEKQKNFPALALAASHGEAV